MTLLKLEFLTSTFVFFVVCFVVREAHKQNNTLAELITSREVGSAALLSVAILCHAIGRDVSEPAVAVNLLQLHVSGLPPQKQKCRGTSAHAHMFFLAPMGLQFI